MPLVSVAGVPGSLRGVLARPLRGGEGELAAFARLLVLCCDWSFRCGSVFWLRRFPDDGVGRRVVVVVVIRVILSTKRGDLFGGPASYRAYKVLFIPNFNYDFLFESWSGQPCQ